jgi:AcrR family transcriptional regulator
VTPRATKAPTTPPRRTQRERREATIAALLDATIASILAVGYARTTVKEICARAELSHGALFRFFPSLIALVIAATEEVTRRQIAQFEARFARASPGAEPLATALAILRDTCRGPTNTVLYELLVAARTDEGLRRALRPALRRYDAAIFATARKVPGTDALPDGALELLLTTVIHAFDGEAMQRAVWPRPDLDAPRMDLLVGLLRCFSGDATGDRRPPRPARTRAKA